MKKLFIIIFAISIFSVHAGVSDVDEQLYANIAASNVTFELVQQYCDALFAQREIVSFFRQVDGSLSPMVTSQSLYPVVFRETEPGNEIYEKVFTHPLDPWG